MVRKTVVLLAFSHLGAQYVAAQNDTQGHLRLQVQMPLHAHGRLFWTVFDSPDGFPGNRSKSRLHGSAPEYSGVPNVQIDTGPLAAGTYAVAVYLDLNGNGKLDYRFPGIPKEPVGASNNPPGRLGPPRFSDAAFVHRAEDQTVVIRLVDPK